MYFFMLICGHIYTSTNNIIFPVLRSTHSFQWGSHFLERGLLRGELSRLRLIPSFQRGSLFLFFYFFIEGVTPLFPEGESLLLEQVPLLRVQCFLFLHVLQGVEGGLK